jgi:hypothetical protein
MSDQFTTWLDEEGNLYMQGGTLIDLTASPTAVYTLAQTGDLPFVTDLQSFRRTPQFSGQLFQGGSGRNVISTGTLSGTNAPIGYFRQIAEDVWGDGYGTEITFDPSDGSASMDNGADQIATMGAGAATIAPYGTFSSTATGETIYNGGTPFSLTVTYEGRNTFPALLIDVDGGTAQTGVYSSTGWGGWDSDDDAAWFVAVDSGGSARISDGVDDVAERATGQDGIGAGSYVATGYGETNYNGGDPFTMVATSIPVPAPITGYLYVTVTLAAGVVTGMSGPNYAAAMPANSSTAKHVPICHSNGSSVYQIQQGPILWR